MRTNMRLLGCTPILAAVVILGTGCPTGTPTDESYDQGFDDGFALDEWYWDGYFDGYDTLGYSPIYYDTSGIPYLDSPPYDAGYWDGVWYAYNDGYFVDYHYAFILGFSEGYDNAFQSKYLDFLYYDQHIEYDNGGWEDGYNDGFSEGRVFGAYDYEAWLPFDWLDALLDYESGTDLYFEEVDVGTGIYGPVYLYEYGTDPNTFKRAATLDRGTKAPLTIRRSTATKDVNLDLLSIYRPLDPQAQQDLQVTPTQSLRSSIALQMDTSWLQRIDSYLNAYKSATKSHTKRTGRTPPQ